MTITKRKKKRKGPKHLKATVKKPKAKFQKPRPTNKSSKKLT
jgi:hypothetical protein